MSEIRWKAGSKCTDCDWIGTVTSVCPKCGEEVNKVMALTVQSKSVRPSLLKSETPIRACGDNMRTIWKYTLERKVYKIQPLFIPITAKVVHVEMGDCVVNLWIETDTTRAIVEGRNFFILGTGRPIPDDSIYVGTVTEGPDSLKKIYVWHIFEGDKSDERDSTSI